MKALQFLQPEQRLEVHDVPWPTVSAPHDVIVRVAFAGVCGTDLHALSGHYRIAPEWTTMGHELSGLVAEVGGAVSSVAVGDRVVVNPNRGCGVCRACKLGNNHFCATESIRDSLGFWRPGGWAEAVLAPEADVHPLLAGVPLSSAALCEPVACLLHALDLFEPLPAHGRVVVLGAGIIGLLTACLLHHRGITDVTISEPGPARRRFVDGLRLGYRAAAPAELAAEFAALSDEQVAADGVDVVIECSAFCPAIEQAAGWLRRGGALCLFGVAPPEGCVSLSPYLLVTRELSVRSAVASPDTFPRATAMVAALGARYLDPPRLGVEVFKLEQYQEAVDKLKKGEISKAMFAMNDTLE
ncbi:2-deoxy-scyllo-inosamine dehydrogenase-like [Amphibalanus amphitrite]|uniref:2-deoxy-scyllo-inosamine dehydrogenase-like n=1 Tax=Amphibalanus amphitrite TaxID=1232801 RepID=UPI001C9111A2|nr:2-deoxy-scyllo-inosamine dehydrogenase-like [Amphibalanus amphitrite]